MQRSAVRCAIFLHLYNPRFSPVRLQEVKFSENIDFQFPMREACTTEVAAFCKDVPSGEARVIRCLQVWGR